MHLIIFLHIQHYYIQKLGFFKGFFVPAIVFFKKIRISLFFVLSPSFFYFFITQSSHWHAILYSVLADKSEPYRLQFQQIILVGSIIFHNSCFPVCKIHTGKHSPHKKGCTTWYIPRFTFSDISLYTVRYKIPASSTLLPAFPVQ